MSAVLLKGGRVVDPANDLDSVMDVLVRGGAVERVAESIDAPPGCEVVDVSGKHVMPGLVDMHVHFREPGHTHKEEIETGMRAALAGGVTTVVTMPNTDPVCDSAEIVQLQQDRARGLDMVHLYVVGALTRGEEGKEVAAIADMKEAGVVALSDDGRDVQDEDVLRACMVEAVKHDLPVLPHCEDVTQYPEGHMNEGEVSARLGHQGTPCAAESTSVEKHLRIAQETGARVHVAHVSCKDSLDTIHAYQEKGLPVTSETCPQYFTLTDEIVEQRGAYAKMYPPIRTERDKQGVIARLRDGTISVISTDHAPHALEEKETDFAAAAKGSTGLETSFAVGYTHLVLPGHLSLFALVEKMAVNPAAVLGLEAGSLREGVRADIAVFDLKKKWTVRVADFETRGANSVFEGMELKGKVDRVFVEGVEKVRDGKIL